jgi:hypothetical protein
MKRLGSVSTCLTVASVILLVGCGRTVRGPDAWPHQPYWNTGIPAHGEESATYYGWPNVGLSGSLTWISPNDPASRIDASEVAARSVRFLRIHGLDCTPIDHAQRQARRYDSEAPIWNGLSYRDTYRLAATNPLSRGTNLYPQAVVIVSLDPTILVIAPGLVGASGLPGGLVYDNRIPMVKGIRWCSPDLNIAPEAIVIDGQGVGTIPVPWGTLSLVPAGDIYAVLAAPD